MVKKRLKIVWDNEAKHSLRSIYNYIKKRESQDRAKQVRDRIVAAAKSVNDFPEKLQEEPALVDEPGNYRYKVIWSYKIIYEVTDELIYVVDVFHTSRDPSNMKGR